MSDGNAIGGHAHCYQDGCYKQCITFLNKSLDTYTNAPSKSKYQETNYPCLLKNNTPPPILSKPTHQQ